MLIAGVLPARVFSRQDFDMLTALLYPVADLKTLQKFSFGEVEVDSKSDFQPCFGKRNKLWTVFITPSAYEVKKGWVISFDFVGRHPVLVPES